MAFMALEEFVTFVIFSDGCAVLEVGCALSCAVYGGVDCDVARSLLP